MAIGQGDGSIILKTKVDTKGIKQGTNSIMAMAKKAGSALAVAFSVKKIADFVKASVDAFAEYEQLVGGVETLFKKSADKVMKYANEAYKTAGMSANEYMANVTSFSASLLSSLGGDTDKAAEVANAALISISDNANKMGTNMESVTMAFQGFAKQQYMLLDNLKLGYGGTKTEMERLLKDAQAITGVEYDIDNLADVYTAIGVIQEKLGIAGTTAKEAATTISGAAGMMRASWQNVLVAISGGGDMDAAIDNLANSVDIYFDNILPVIEKAIHGIGIMIEKIAPKLAETVGRAFIAEIPRLTTAIYAMIVGAFKGLYQGIVALFKKETNAMLEEQAEKTEETAKNQEKVTDNIKETNKELKKTLAGFDDIQILSSSAAENTSDGLDGGLDGGLQDIGGDFGGTAPDGSAYEQEISSTLTAIMGVVGVALAALGCILLFTGHIGWGLGFLIASAAVLGVTVATLGDDTIAQETKDALSNALIIAGVVAILIGILLCMASQWGIGIGMMVIGVSSIVAPIALNWDGIKEQLQGSFGGWLVLGGIIAIVLGILLCFTPMLPLGIGLIVLGAAAVVAPVVANWDAITERLHNFFTENAGLITGASIGLIVLGILLCFTPMIGLGIGLIVAGAAGLATVAAVNWNAIVDWVKGAWEAVKAFWNKYIAPVFTVKFWLDLAKKCGNGLIGGFEAAINGIIGMFEKMINWIVNGINKISFDVPDWVPGIGGKKFGFNIPKAKFDRVSIPRLAQGAVIPANREFLAVLGDQKQGVNIEAPLQTIVDAFNIALAQNGGRGNTEVILEVDGREFGRAVVEQGNRENRRVGTRLVIG